MGQPMPDDVLAGALTSLFAETDPVPDLLRTAASEAFAWRDVDAALAGLVSDSLAGAGAAVVRGAAPRLLSFATADVAIDLEITEDGDSVRVLGQISPGRDVDVTIEHVRGRSTARSDEIGRFHFDGLPAGWLRVVVDAGADGTGRSHTEWIKP
jgi:hypothetical protein